MKYGKAELKKEPASFIISGVERFREKYSLAPEELVIVTGGDIVESLTAQKVLYSDFKADYAVFEPESAAEADRIAGIFAEKGAEVRAEPRFGDKVFLFVFSPGIPIPVGAYPETPLPEDWTPPVTEHKILESAATPGEMTPFYFNGELYCLSNFHHANADGGMDVGCEIRREKDDELISTPWIGYYFSMVFVHDGKCWCFGRSESCSYQLCMTVSEDLVNWSAPEVILDLTAEKITIFNCYVTFDGTRFVLAYENNDPAYPIFTLKFLESRDLRHWTAIDGAIYGEDKYIGGPSMYYMPDGYFYVTYVDQFVHPEVRRLCYRTSIARSKDLINWEDAPEWRAVISPDYRHQPSPEEHPEVFEINVSDAEYIEIGNKVRVYFNGGNQQGCGDQKYAEWEGTLLEFFQLFFK